MGAVGFPDSWTEFFLIDIGRQGGSTVSFAAATEDITEMNWGEKDVESIPTAAGGRIIKNVPMTDESITLKMYPVSVDLDGTGIMQFFHPQAADDTTDPIVVVNTKTRNRHKATLLWASTLPADAETVPEANASALRIQIFSAYITAAKYSHDDKTLSVEVTLKWAPFQKDGTRNKIEESTDGSVVLAAVTAYS